MKSKEQINNRILNQVILITIIVIICLLIFTKMTYYLPGFLGAITLYILLRNFNFKLTENYRWNKSATAILFIFSAIVFLVIPAWLIIDYLTPGIVSFLNNPDDIVKAYTEIRLFLKDKPVLNNIDLSEESLRRFLQSLTRFLPQVINSVAEILINIVVSLFVLFFMLVRGREMENVIESMFPFSEKSKEEVWHEIHKMVKMNAIGIPILAVCQGITAVLGYTFFDVKNAFLWGMLTGIFSVFPFLGSMIIYIPICILYFASGDTINGIWLSLYCFFIVGGIDNVLRFTILKTLGNVHPLITVFGVLLGLNLFGMLGLIFGPLIISSVSVLFKVYHNEYGSRKGIFLKKPLFKGEDDEDNL